MSVQQEIPAITGTEVSALDHGATPVSAGKHELPNEAGASALSWVTRTKSATRARRRAFSLAEKRPMVQKTEQCIRLGELGALMRTVQPRGVVGKHAHQRPLQHHRRRSHGGCTASLAVPLDIFSVPGVRGASRSCRDPSRLVGCQAMETQAPEPWVAVRRRSRFSIRRLCCWSI